MFVEDLSEKFSEATDFLIFSLRSVYLKSRQQSSTYLLTESCSSSPRRVRMVYTFVWLIIVRWKNATKLLSNLCSSMIRLLRSICVWFHRFSINSRTDFIRIAKAEYIKRWIAIIMVSINYRIHRFQYNFVNTDIEICKSQFSRSSPLVSPRVRTRKRAISDRVCGTGNTTAAKKLRVVTFEIPALTIKAAAAAWTSADFRGRPRKERGFSILWWIGNEPAADTTLASRLVVGSVSRLANESVVKRK